MPVSDKSVCVHIPVVMAVNDDNTGQLHVDFHLSG